MNKSLKDLRLEKNMTLEDLSLLSKVSKSSLTKLENGSAKNPRVSTVVKIAIALHYPIADVCLSILQNGK